MAKAKKPAAKKPAAKREKIKEITGEDLLNSLESTGATIEATKDGKAIRCTPDESK